MHLIVRRLAFAAAAWLATVAPTYAQPQGTPPLGVAPLAAPGDTFAAWIGYGGSQTFDGGYAGFVLALNQLNLNAEGWILRGEVSGGVYDPSVTTHGAALLFGYRAGVGPGFLTGYVGVAYETHNNAPIGAVVTGAEGGGKVAIEYFIPQSGMFEFYSLATYATPFETYFAFARPSFRAAPNFRFGPEAMLFGNIAYRDVRVGGFIGLKIDQVVQRGEIVVSGGYLHPLVTGNSDGYYINVTLSITR